MWPFTRKAAAVETVTARSGSETKALDWSLADILAPGASVTGLPAVGPHNAERSATARAAIAAIAETVGSLPVHVYSRNAGVKERETAHPAARLLSGDFSPWASSTDVRTQLQRDALLTGAGFALVVRNGKGDPREVHRLPPHSVTVETAADGSPQYRFQSDAGPRILSWRDVIVIRVPGASADLPLNLTKSAQAAIQLDVALGEFMARVFGQGGRPSGILRVPAGVSQDALKRIAALWQAAHAGGNSGKTAILDGGAEFQQVSLSLVDAQALEARRFVVAEIARTYRVPLPLVGDLERATWSNITELGQQFLTYTVLPWLEVWQSALERVLLKPSDRGRYFIEFVTDDLVRADIAKRYEAFSRAVGNAAWASPNEVRSLDNLPPIAGGDALIRQAGQSGAAAPQNEEIPNGAGL